MALEEEVEGHNGTEVVTSTENLISENLISEVETGVIATPEQHHYIERLKDLQNEVVEGTHTHILPKAQVKETQDKDSICLHILSCPCLCGFGLFCVR